MCVCVCTAGALNEMSWGGGGGGVGGGGGEVSDSIWRETGAASDSRLVSELSEEGG